MSNRAMSNRRAWLTHKRVLAAALLLVAILSTINSVVNPLFEPPDELQHYQFVRHLVDSGTLPIQAPDGPVSQSHQPPLYYLGGAALVAAIDDPQTLPERNPFWAYYAADEASRDNKLQFLNADVYAFPYTGTALVIHVLRLWSVLLSLGTVTAVWLLARTLWPNDPVKVALMLAIGVLNPMFLYIAGAANNDSLVIMLGAVMLWLTVKALDDGFTWRTTFLIGLVWGLALLSKLTGLILVAPWGFALLWTAQQKRDGKLFISQLTAVLALSLGISSWWFIRNARIYDDPLALQVVLDVWGERPLEKATQAYLWPDVRYSWTNFWGRFGYGQVPLPDGIYWLFLLLCGAALAGGLVWLARRRGQTARWGYWLTLSAAAAAYGAGLFYYIYRNTTGANGRYVFPSLPALAALITAGLSVWFKRRRSLHIALAAILAGIAIYTATIFLPWIYARPKLLTKAEAMAHAERPADLVFGDGIRLLGTAVSSPEAGNGETVAGETVTVAACWQAQAAMNDNYTLFIRLLDHEQNSLGQRDTYPGLGTFPTSFWQPGAIFCDETPIQLTKELDLPTVAEIEMGFYHLDNDQALLIVAPGDVPVDRAVVGQMKIRPSASPIPPIPQQELTAQFRQDVALIGYNWSTDKTAVNNTINIELIWRAGGPLDRSYTVFAHLLDNAGQIIAQDDGLPRDGAYPTNFWVDGDIIADTHTFALPSDAPPGPTTVRVGFYLLEDFSRLPRTANADQPDFVEFDGPIVIEE
ncbi:MAG: hypothetical protein GY803_20745 [Chloroflexi bacterium]|nr:hypothetical protein [Chloroflexota bacterium]